MKNKVPTQEEYLQLMREWNAAETIEDKNKAATEILEGLSGLIWKLIKKRGYWISEDMQDDCFAEANLTLLRSGLPAFDEEKAATCKFTSYATNWIIHAILRNMEKTRSTVVIPIDGRRQAIKALNAGQELTEKQQAYLPQIVYWDREVEGDSGESRCLRDVICDREDISVQPEGFEEIERKRNIEYAQKLLNVIKDDKSRAVVIGRINGRTYGEIGALLGLSRQRVEQIYSKTIKELQLRVKKWDRDETNVKLKIKPKKKPAKIKVIDRTTKKAKSAKPAKDTSLELCRKTLSKRYNSRVLQRRLSLD